MTTLNEYNTIRSRDQIIKGDAGGRPHPFGANDEVDIIRLLLEQAQYTKPHRLIQEISKAFNRKLLHFV